MKRTISTVFILLLVLLLGPDLVLAQQTDRDTRRAERKARKAEIKASTDHYQRSGTQAMVLTLRDTRMTPLWYRAPGLGLVAGQTDRRPGVVEHMDFVIGQYGFLSPIGEGSDGHAFRVLGGHSHLRQISLSDSRWKLFVGGGIKGQYGGRLIPALGNSLYHHELTANLRADAEASRPFTLFGRNYDLRLRAQLPLFTYLNRWPEYGLVIAGSAHHFAPIGVWNQITASFTWEGLMSERNDNRWQLTYHYDLYQFSDEFHRLFSAAHILEFAYLLHY